MFSYLEDHHKEALALNHKVVERLVSDSVKIKAGVVNRDETEHGERKKLNFGHTIGHALEKISDINHGEAVSIGMHIAARLSQKKGYISVAEVGRIEGLLRSLKLPTRLEFNRKQVLDALKKDKKRKGDDMDFILLKGIGKAIIKEIPINELEKVLKEL